MPIRFQIRVSRLYFSALVLVSIVLAGSGWQAWRGSWEANEAAAVLAKQMQAEARVEALGREALEALTFGYYQGHSQWLEKAQAQAAAMGDAQWKADRATGVFFLTVLGWALLLGRSAGRAALGYGLLWASGFALVVGLSAPILSIVAQEDLPVLGLTVIQWESKAILDTVHSLWQVGNRFPAGLILLFSVLIPAFKLAVPLLHFMESRHPFTRHGARLAQHLGKWSMADVFVVALLVTYLGAGKNDNMHASLQTGLYFFAAYVLLSMAGGILTQSRNERDSRQT